MAKVILPQSLVTLFPGCPRQVEVEAETVQGVIDQLNVRWPGMRNRLLDAGPVLRQHILVAIDGQTVDLATPVGPDTQVRIIPSITGG